MGVYWAEIADKNQTDRQIQFLKRHLKPNGYILDVACGTGRHSIPLSKEGRTMVGLDISAKLLRIAKQRWREVQVVRGDIRFLPFKSQAFVAAVSIDTSFGYLPSQEEDILSLTELQDTLEKGGMFVIDVFNREKLILKYREENHSFKWKEYPSFFLKQKRSVSQRGNWLCDSWIIRDKASGRLMFYDHNVRLYGRSELEDFMDRVGFAVERVYGGYEGENFSPNSPRLILLAKAK
jgi:ubiquinone/menaquinone biosynthesis C-methylase UbiE